MNQEDLYRNLGDGVGSGSGIHDGASKLVGERKGVQYSFHAGAPKPFRCDLCGYTCNALGRLKRHMMTHTGERPFACPHCDYRASRKSHLSNHLVTHTGIKPFRCTICDYRCARKSHLKRHVEALHIELFEDAMKMTDDELMRALEKAKRPTGKKKMM